MKITSARCVSISLVLAVFGLSAVQAADVFVRFKVLEPPGEKFRVTAGGYIHVANWRLPDQRVEVAGGQWSRWLDLRKWPLHGRLDREGGLAEWPADELLPWAGWGKASRSAAAPSRCNWPTSPRLRVP